MKKNYISRHVNIDLYNCDPNKLNDKNFVIESLTQAAKDCNCNIITHHFHEFEPHGISGVLILSESHISYHGWSERKFCAIDLFYCSDYVDEKLFEKIISQYFSNDSEKCVTKIRYLNRGFFPD